VPALLPEGGPRRLLAAATLLTMLGYGIYLTAGVLYLTQGLHLPPAEVGLGMSVAGAVSLAAGIPIGHLADRRGARGVYAGTLLVGGAAMAGFCFARTFWPFLACATFSAVAQSAGSAARGPLVQKYGGERPAEFRSYLRAVTNLGIAVGALAAAWALEQDTRSAYMLIIGASAISYGIGALLAGAMPNVPPRRANPGPRWIALRDRPYVVLTLLDGLMAVQYRVLTVAVPLWLLGIDAGLNHSRLGLAPLAGLALGLAGVGLLSGLGARAAGISGWGVVIILAAAAAWALGTIMAGRVTLPASPLLASGMQLLCGGAALLALSGSTGEFGSLRLAEVSARSWLALGYLIVIGSIVAFSAYGIAVRALPTATVATYAYVNPVIAVLLGTLILNERLTPAMLGGGALIVGAVVLVVRRGPAVR